MLFEDDLKLKYSIFFVRFYMKKGAAAVTVPTHERFLFTKHVLCGGIVVKVDFLLGKCTFLVRNMDLDMRFLIPGSWQCMLY